MPSLSARSQTGRMVREYVCESTQTFEVGAAVVLVSDEVEECGADPAEILGFALHAAGKHVEDPVDGTPSKVLVSVAHEGATFLMPASAAVAASDLDASYGLVDDAGTWKVDKSDTTATRVYVVRVFEDLDMLEVRVLAANRQYTP